MKKLISILSASLLTITPATVFVTGCAVPGVMSENVNWEHIRFSEGDNYEVIQYKAWYALQATPKYTKKIKYSLTWKNIKGKDEMYLPEDYIAKMDEYICIKLEPDFPVQNTCGRIKPYNGQIPGKERDPRDNLGTRDFYVTVGQIVYDIVKSIISFKYDVPRKDWTLYIETTGNKDPKEKEWTKVINEKQKAEKGDEFRVVAAHYSKFIIYSKEFKVIS